MNTSGAIISKDNRYRYSLWRIWDDTKPFVLFLMLNPSTVEADPASDDATTRRCRSFAMSNGYGGFYIGNLFAYRARFYPNLCKADDRIGPEYDYWMASMLLSCQTVVFAWGAFPLVKDRQQKFIDLCPDALCLGTTREGYPRHPLYVAGNTPLSKFSLAFPVTNS